MSRELRFTKMHGAGNDFVVLDGLRDALPPIAPLAARLCDRHLGIGADQLLVVRPSRAPTSAWRSGTPTARRSRCARTASALLQVPARRAATRARRDRRRDALRRGAAALGRRRTASPSTWAARSWRPRRSRRRSAAGDGPVLDVPLEVAGETLRVSSVSMGNPHAVVFVDDPETAPVEQLRARDRAPPGVPEPRERRVRRAVLDRGRIQQRTWERGAGETLACGSGACAVAVVSMLRGVVGSRRSASSCAAACSRSPGPPTTRTSR